MANEGALRTFSALGAKEQQNFDQIHAKSRKAFGRNLAATMFLSHFSDANHILVFCD
jgi:hypothetical protein